MVDANSAYTLEDAPLLKQLDAFYLIMIEQPLGWDDIYSHARCSASSIRRSASTSASTISSMRARQSKSARARIINIKLGRVGGHTAARRIHDLCQTKSIPVWCGGMLESGIGRAHNIAMSTLPNFSLPGDVSASRRYWAEDIIEPEVEVTPTRHDSRSHGAGNRLHAAPRAHRIAHQAPRGARLKAKPRARN